MTCEEVREFIVAGAGWLRSRQAHRHVRGCHECSAWFAGLHQMARLLDATPAHEMPPALEHKLLAAVMESLARSAPRVQVRSKWEGIRVKVIVSALSVAVVAAIAVGAFLFLSPRAQSVAWADVVNALRGVNTVHMTGEKQLAFVTDKWIRREPFAVYEHNWPLNPKTAKQASLEYIWAGNSEKMWWYSPRRGNRAVIGHGLQGNFMDDVLAPTESTGTPGSEPPYRVVGRSTVDGKAVVIFSDAPGEKKQTELAVDPVTKLTIRIRQFEPDAHGKSIVVTRLRLEYNQTPPAGIFDWRPPAGATIVDKRRPRGAAR